MQENKKRKPCIVTRRHILLYSSPQYDLLGGNAGLPLKNHKIYKHPFVNNINILPGGLRRLPDDCFSYYFMNVKGDLI